MTMKVDSVHFKGHLCFKKEWSGFDTIKPINVIIGRNNSGKSHLLDLVEALCDNKLEGRGWEYRFRGVLDEPSLRQQFDEYTSGGVLGGNHWNDHGKYFIGVEISWETDKDGKPLNFQFPGGFHPEYLPSPNKMKARLSVIGQAVETPIHELTRTSFRRLLADRDIRIAPPSPDLSLSPDGGGASNIIRRFLNSSSEKFSTEVIDQDLLNALNNVFRNDGRFTGIRVQEHDEGTSEARGSWEVYLGEEKKGLIPLSKSGSGLKTVLLVLLNLIVIPEIEEKEKSQFTFAFEELENNLHPALLRRLLQYLEKYAVENESTLFLTTHSSTTLDLFGASKNAQIIHVVHDGGSARSAPVSAHFDRLGVLSELGAKPSDLLQANGIVWVEGPSDRIYLNRWIDLRSGGRLQEGRDYQCAFYGGSLLARLQFTSPEEADADLANLFQVNPNIVVVCDGDRTSKRARIKDRVRRIHREVEKIPNGHVWITSAKEIENYIPGSVLNDAFHQSSLPDLDQYEPFFPSERGASKSYVERKLKRRSFDKMELALASAPYMTKERMVSRFDWEDEMKKIVDCIESWNA